MDAATQLLMFSGAVLGRAGTVTPAATTFNYFSDNGGTWPWYGDSHQPAIYFSDTNTTWFSWETAIGQVRYAQVRTYNHTTQVWSKIYFAGLNSLITDDDHGGPTLWRDTSGYVYCFYGAHATNQPWSVSTSPNDPSAWTQKTAIVGSYSYPNCYDVGGSTLYLFNRGDDTAGGSFASERYLSVMTGAAGGNPTWSAATKLIDFGLNNRVYQGRGFVIGTEIYIPFTYADTGNTLRQDVYLLRYDTTTGNIKSLDGSTTVLAASLPISRTTARTSFMLVDQQTSSLTGNIPQVGVSNPSGNIHVVYMEGTAATSFNLKHIVWNGSSLSSPVTVTAIPSNNSQHQYDRDCIVPLPNDVMDIYYISASPSAYTWGGDVSKISRAANGTLGASAVIRAANSTFPLNAVCPVINGSANARVVFGETVVQADWAANEKPRLQKFAYGDGGYLGIPFDAGYPFNPLSYFTTTVNYWVSLQSDGRLMTDASQTWAWQDRANGYLFAGSSPPTYNATGWDGTLPALTGNGVDSGNVLNSQTSVFGATQSVFIVTKRGTQADVNASSFRPLLVSPVSSGGAAGFVSVLRPTADAGQTIMTNSGQSTGSVRADAPGGLANGAKGVVYARIKATSGLLSNVNGGTLSTAGNLGTTTASAVGLFGASGAGTGQRYSGDIVEVLILAQDVTTAERQWVEGSLAWKWGIQSSLAAGHPYQSTRPGAAP